MSATRTWRGTIFRRVIAIVVAANVPTIFVAAYILTISGREQGYAFFHTVKDVKLFVFVFLPLSYVAFGIFATVIYFITRVIGRSSLHFLILLSGSLAVLLTSAFYLFAYEYGVRAEISLGNWSLLSSIVVTIFVTCVIVFYWIAQARPIPSDQNSKRHSK